MDEEQFSVHKSVYSLINLSSIKDKPKRSNSKHNKVLADIFQKPPEQF